MEDERDLKKTVKKSGEKGLFKKKRVPEVRNEKNTPPKKKKRKGAQKEKRKKGAKKLPFLLRGKKIKNGGFPFFLPSF